MRIGMGQIDCLEKRDTLGRHSGVYGGKVALTIWARAVEFSTDHACGVTCF